MSNRLTQCLVQMTTVSSMDGGITCVYGSIFSLVKVGFYTTVWYKFIPCEIDIPPEELLYISCDYFLNDQAIVPGYTKITLQETKDISDIVMSARDDTPFPFDDTSFHFHDNPGDDNPLNEMPQLDPAIEIAMDNINRKWRVGVSLGIIIAFCVAIGIYPE